MAVGNPLWQHYTSNNATAFPGKNKWDKNITYSTIYSKWRVQKFLITNSCIFLKSEIMNNRSLPLQWLVSLVFPVHESFLLVCSTCTEREKKRERSELYIRTVPCNSQEFTFWIRKAFSRLILTRASVAHMNMWQRCLSFQHHSFVAARLG